jgi:hypothetical protein
VTKVFNINIQVKKTKVVCLFDFGSQDNLIGEYFLRNIGLEVHDHPNPYPLGWVNKHVDIEATKKCKINFYVIKKYNDEVEVDVLPLDVCGVVFGRPYMYMREEIFMRREN